MPRLPAREHHAGVGCLWKFASSDPREGDQQGNGEDLEHDEWHERPENNAQRDTRRGNRLLIEGCRAEGWRQERYLHAHAEKHAYDEMRSDEYRKGNIPFLLLERGHPVGRCAWLPSCMIANGRDWGEP